MSRRALIAWGGWDGHEPEPVRGRRRRHAARARASTSGSSTAPPPSPTPRSPSLDLIVPIVTMSTIGKDELAGLTAAVEAGTGLAGFHGGMGDSFREAVDYQFMVGGQWVAHPGNIIDYRVDITSPTTPSSPASRASPTAPSSTTCTSIPSNEVLATTTFSGAHAPWIDGVVMPVVWKRRHGAGRVFYSSLGHKAEELTRPRGRDHPPPRHGLGRAGTEGPRGDCRLRNRKRRFLQLGCINVNVSKSASRQIRCNIAHGRGQSPWPPAGALGKALRKRRRMPNAPRGAEGVGNLQPPVRRTQIRANAPFTGLAPPAASVHEISA